MSIVEANAEQHEPVDHPTNTNVVLVGQVLCILVPFVIWSCRSTSIRRSNMFLRLSGS